MATKKVNSEQTIRENHFGQFEGMRKLFKGRVEAYHSCNTFYWDAADKMLYVCDGVTAIRRLVDDDQMKSLKVYMGSFDETVSQKLYASLADRYPSSSYGIPDFPIDNIKSYFTSDKKQAVSASTLMYNPLLTILECVNMMGIGFVHFTQEAIIEEKQVLYMNCEGVEILTVAATF